MASLVDTNILVYCFDSQALVKRAQARELLRRGAAESTILIPHQALTEFVSVVTRRKGYGTPLLPEEEAIRQAEGFMADFQVLYPNERVFRTALLGMATYRLSWFDAHLWAYASHYSIPELLSEDFEHGRGYGTVRVRNPFLSAGLA
ncbi:MAG: PIN domain-containing protein [Candidatus Sulfotelmatobacter sp.]